MAEVKHLIRIANTDIKGTKPLMYGLRRIKGVGLNLANALCRLTKLDPAMKIGSLSEAQISKITTILNDPIKAGIPIWMLNRRRDRETGANKHILGTKLKLTLDEDLKSMKKIRCYKGIRHMFRLPVRGQRTKSNFRPNKGKTSLGVKTKSKSKGRV